jgi:hypothetical protein
MKLPILNALLTAALLGAATTYSSDLASAAEAETHTAIPNTPAEIWRAIDGHIAELKGLIAKGTLTTVHQHAFAVRDLVRALPTHSPSLSVAALANVSAEVKFVDTLAARLDESGDANDKAGTAANLAKLENILKAIRSQYGSH